MSRLLRILVRREAALLALLALNIARAQAQQDDASGESAQPPAASEDEPAAHSPDEDGVPLAPSSDSSVRVTVLAGGGIGTRGFRRPTAKGSQRLRDSVFPAVDIGLRVSVWPEESFSLAFSLRYQTSFAWKVQDEPLFASATRIGVRAERVELAVAPGLRLGDSPRSALLSVPVGFNMRTLWPTVHDLPVPGYSVLGPFARPELALSLGDALVLRVGPELQWIVSVDRAIQLDGASAQGFAVGGELSLKVPLGRKLALELSYRQAHAIVPGQAGRRSLQDVERFATARLSGTL